MIMGVKICGVSDLKTLKYIIEHPHPPQFIGFITNYKKSKRYLEYKKLKELVDTKKKKINFVISDLTNPNKKNGVVCSGFGSKPIQLNTNIKYYNSMYWDWQNFEDELLTRLLRDQNNINQNGYYPKEKN